MIIPDLVLHSYNSNLIEQRNDTDTEHIELAPDTLPTMPKTHHWNASILSRIFSLKNVETLSSQQMDKENDVSFNESLFAFERKKNRLFQTTIRKWALILLCGLLWCFATGVSPVRNQIKFGSGWEICFHFKIGLTVMRILNQRFFFVYVPKWFVNF